jgi:4-hydroxybutyryl-CoA dehydratase/vinylacetyl-CoA-Delta-isomerase
MAIRTPEQYLRSLNDGREIWFQGERARDLSQHPHIRTCAEIGAMDYALCQDPRYQDLLLEKDKDGEPYHFVFKPAESAKDLLRRREIIQLTARTCFGMPGGTKFTGIDGLNAITSVSRRMDRELGTSYGPRVEAYRQHLKKIDAAVAVAVTDVKGDRSLHPSKQKQHRDFYLRLVDERRDGIVVRGAKVHISWAPIVNEVIVVPCRAMREYDREYAVAFAVPPDTKGLKFIMSQPEVDDENDFDSPLSAHIYTGEALVVFDDVFIPVDRVFLKGEWKYAANFAYMFANFHRVSADAYKFTENEILVGAAALMAEYNGLEKVPHIQDKLSWLAWYTETTEAIGRAACQDCVMDAESGLVYPNPVYSNAAKFFFADNYHQALKHLVDIAGGIVATVPPGKDFFNPQTRPYVEKYLAGKDGIPTEHRIRAIKLTRDLASMWIQLNTLHGEGSLAAQRMSIFNTADFSRYKAAAKRVAGIDDGQQHPIFGKLPHFPGWTWRKKK